MEQMKKRKTLSEVIVMGLNSKLKDENTDFLFRCILELKSVDE